MKENITRKKQSGARSTTWWSSTTTLYLLCSCLLVSCPLLAPISGWVQGTTPTSLQCYENADKLFQLYHVNLLHIHENVFIGKLQHCDPHIAALRPILKHKRGHLKTINIRGFFTSLILSIFSSGSILASFLIPFFVLGTLKISLSVCALALCIDLILVQCELLKYVVTHKTNHKRIQEQVELCTHVFIQENLTYVAVYVKVYSPRAVISSLLLMAGDIESNPGPTPPSSPAPVPPTSSPKSSDSPDLPPESPTTSNSEAQTSTAHGQSLAASLLQKGTLPVKVTGRDNIDSTGRKFNVVVSPLNPAVTNEHQPKSSYVSPNEETMAALVSGTQSISLMDSETVKPKPQPSDKRVTTKPGPSSSGTFNNEQLAKPQQETTLSSTARRENIHDTVAPPDFREKKNHSDISLNDFVQDARQQLRGFRTYFDVKKLWYPETGFVPRTWSSFNGMSLQTRSEEEEIPVNFPIDRVIQLMLTLNRLYRVGEGWLICPICTREKLSFNSPKSHVIPQAVLLVYKRIHGSMIEDVQANFLYDLSRGEQLGASGLTIPMMCIECESNNTRCREAENKLKALYSLVMVNPHCSLKGENEWFLPILAIILFRGLLVGVKLTEDMFQHDSFRETFFTLWWYCKSYLEFGKCENPPNIKLFILPNAPINEKMSFFMYGIEFVLRSPMFTQYVRSRDNGTYLYTKFDCFHIVLPVDDKATLYFDSFRRCMYTTHSDNCVSLNLRKCEVDVKVSRAKNSIPDETRTRKATRRDSIQIKCPKRVKPTCFPEGLLRFNVEQYGDIVFIGYHHCNRKFNEEGIRGFVYQYPGLDYKYPNHQNLTYATNATLDHDNEVGTTESFNICKLTKKGIDEMIETASKQSPLNKFKRLEKEKEKELKQKKEELERQKEEVERLQSELKEAKQFEYQLRSLTSANEALKGEHKILNQKFHAVSSLLYSQMRHVTSKVRKAQITARQQKTPLEIGVIAHDGLINELLHILDDITKDSEACSEGRVFKRRCRELKEHIAKEFEHIKKTPPHMPVPSLARCHSLDH